jgi:hypothetical protein
MRSFFFGVIMLLASAANAATVTLDFDEYENVQGYPDPEATSNGFLITGGLVAPSGFIVGGNYYQTLSKIDGGTFNMLSVDIAAGLDGAIEQEWTITGYFAGGGNVVVSDYYPSDNWTTVNFDSTWADLEQVTFSVDVIAPSPYGNNIDNIVMTTAVPIPAAVWLFGSALAGLGWFRRQAA